MSAASRVTFTAGKAAPLPPRKVASTRRVAAAATDGDKPEFWEGVRGAVPALCLSAAMALGSAGAAGALTQGPAYGGAVGGSDVSREVGASVQRVKDAGADLLNDLPTPNLPDPNQAGANRPAGSIGGALNKTASSLKNTFDIGGENVENLGPGVAGNIKSVGEDLKSKAPPAIQSSIDNQSQNARDTLNKGKQEVGGLSNPLQGLFSGGSPADSAKDAVDGARGALQRNTGLTGNPIEDGKNALKGQNPISDAVERNTGSNPLDGVKDFFSGSNPAPSALKESASNQAQNARDSLNKGQQEVGRVTGGNPLQGLFSGGSPADSAKDAVDGARGALQRNTGLTGNPIEDGKNALKGQNPISDAVERNTGSNPLDGVKDFFSGSNPAPSTLKESAANQAQNARDAVGKGQQEVGRVSGGNPLQGLFSGSNPVQDAADGARNVLQRNTSFTPGQNPVDSARDALQSTTGLTGNPIEDGKNALKGQNPISDMQRNTGSNPLDGVKDFFSGSNPAPSTLKESASNQAQNARDALNKGQQEVGRVSGGNPLQGLFSGGSPADGAKDAVDGARGALQRNTGLTGNPIEDGKNALKGQNPVSDALQGANPLDDARGALQRSTGLTGNPIEDGKNALKGQNPISDMQRNTVSNPLQGLFSGSSPADGAADAVDNARGALQRSTGLTGNPIEDGKNALKGQNPISDMQRNTGSNPLQEGADRLKDNFFGSGVKNEFEAGNQNMTQNANTVKGAVNKGAGNEQKDLQQGLLKGVSFVFESAPANPLQQTVSQELFSNETGVGQAIKQAQETLTQGGPKNLGQAEEKAIKFGADDAKQGGGIPNPFQGGNPLSGGNTISPNAGAKDAERLLKQGADSVQDSVQSGVNKLQRGVTFEKTQETFKTGGQPLDQGSSERSGNVQSGANMLGNNVYRGVKDTVDDVRERTENMQRGESGIRGLADNVKDNMQQAGQKAQTTGKSIFGQ